MTTPEALIAKLGKIAAEIERVAKLLAPVGHTGDEEDGCDRDCAHCYHDGLMGSIEALLANLEDAAADEILRTLDDAGVWKKP